MTDDTKPGYYTVAQAAAAHHLSRSTIWRWIDSGKLPAYRLGPRSIRIRRQDLETVLQPARNKRHSSQEKRGTMSGANRDEPTSKVLKEQLLSMAGVWSDLDAETMIRRLYEARHAAPPSDSMRLETSAGR